jgi:tetratricopeptide (TPR) repeat protein
MCGSSACWRSFINRLPHREGMTISYSQHEDLECEDCGAKFSTDMWLIVDSSERPDLWADVRASRIHNIACPNGHAVQLDAPLLLRDERQGRIFFSPAKSASASEDEEAAQELGQHIINALPPDAVQGNTLQFERVWRGLLPLALDGKPFQDIQQLQSILRELERPVALAEIPRRIELAEQAVQLASRESVPLYWTRLHAQISKYLLENPHGDRAANVERAIECFERALTVYLREEDEARIIVQVDLGAAYAQRICGERAENLEKAILTFEDALSAADPSVFPKQWAAIQHNLGAAYAERIRGSRADNLERALQAFEAALTIYDLDNYPEDWASTQHNVGNTHSARIHGDRSENIERAIKAYQMALEVRTHERFPEDWANTLNGLARAYLERIHGDAPKMSSARSKHVKLR